MLLGGVYLTLFKTKFRDIGAISRPVNSAKIWGFAYGIPRSGRMTVDLNTNRKSAILTLDINVTPT